MSEEPVKMPYPTYRCPKCNAYQKFGLTDEQIHEIDRGIKGKGLVYYEHKHGGKEQCAAYLLLDSQYRVRGVETENPVEENPNEFVIQEHKPVSI